MRLSRELFRKHLLGRERTDDVKAWEPVDVAFVCEATYPFVRGGVASIMHEMISEMQELSVGIIHVTWDRNAPHSMAYVLPPNVKWVYPVYLAAAEHRAAAADGRSKHVFMSRRTRLSISEEVIDAAKAAARGDYSGVSRVFYAYLHAPTRSYDFWQVYQSREFMQRLLAEMAEQDLTVTDCFWLQREFFSLAYAVLARTYPAASVYHSHVQLYGGVAAIVGAKQHGGRAILTEHGLFVRDNLNYLFRRCTSQPATFLEDLRTTTDPRTRAWVHWFRVLGRLVYHFVDATTYQYVRNFTDAEDLGSQPEKATFISNGIDFDRYAPARLRQSARHGLRQAFFGGAAVGSFSWKIGYMGRIVYVKGVSELINAFALLRQRRNWPMRLEIIGPSNEEPQCLADCLALVERLGLAAAVSFPGSQDLSVALGDVDLLVLPSYSEILPIVVLEALAAGVPVVATDSGSCSQIIAEDVADDGGVIGPAGLVVPIKDHRALADAIEAILGDAARYEAFSANGPLRIKKSHEAKRVMESYRKLYASLGSQLGQRERRPAVITLPGAEVCRNLQTPVANVR